MGDSDDAGSGWAGVGELFMGAAEVGLAQMRLGGHVEVPPEGDQELTWAQ